MMPTIDRTLTGTAVAVGGDQLVVVEAVGLVPHTRGGHRLADGGEVLEELEHQVERRAGGRSGCRIEAMAAMASA